MNKKTGQRRDEILQTIAVMLEATVLEKITTAILAEKLTISEAALYRHFSSKAQMFDGLIHFIDESLMGLVNHIAEKETSGVKQVELMLTSLLGFTQKNLGLTRILTGEVLIYEKPRLLQSVNQLIDKLTTQLKQSLRVGVTQGEFVMDGAKAGETAQFLMSYVIGRWLQFTHSGFTKFPLDGWPEHWRFLQQGMQVKNASSPSSV